MKNILLVFFAFAMLSVCSYGQSPAPEFATVSGGKPAAIFVIPDSGSASMDAAQDMARILSKMTGAKFAIAAEMVDAPCIVVGLASEWEKISKDKSPAERLKGAGNESFLLQSSQKRLLILGKTSEGASHGVYSLLRELGCRWYFPASDWEVIPEKKDLKITVDRIEGPAMKVRILSNGAGLGTSASLFKDWCRRNRLGSEYGQQSVHHSYSSFVPKSLFKEHPEYFAKISKDGEAAGTEQNGEQPCTTHPEVVKLVKEGCLSKLRNAKASGSVPLLISVSPNDGTPNMCRCERCMKVGSYGDCALLLANQAAEAIRGEFPDTLVGFLAYGRASALPMNVKPDPQILVSIATGYNWKTSVPRLIDGWSKLIRHSIIYEYYAIGSHGSYKPDYGGAKIKDMSQLISSWKKMGIEGVNGEMNNDWGSCGHRLWAFAEISWDPSATPDNLMDDFIARSFGPAREPMRRYYQRWESGQSATPRTLALSVSDLQDAAKLASDSQDVLKRIDNLSVFLYWNMLKREYDEVKNDEPAQNRIALEGDIIQYRMRDQLLAQLVGSIYRIDRPYPLGFKNSEVAEMRRQMHEKFSASGAPVEISSMNGSENLVPLSPSSQKPSAAAAVLPVQSFVSTASYRFRAKAGETLSVKFEAEAGAKGKGSASTEKGDGIEDAEKQTEESIGRFQLWGLGAKGDGFSFISEQSPAVKDGIVDLKFQIPADGLYQINVKTKQFGVSENFNGRPYVVVADSKNRKSVLPLERKESQGNSLVSYFIFVPKNTRNFLFQSSAYGVLTADFITTDDGKTVANASIKSRGEMIINVPAGKDACIWEVKVSNKGGRFGLDGIPPYLSRNPSELLVPEEFLKK